MAKVLGLSKKTLVEIEKGRSSLGWTGSVALCGIFGESQTVMGVFGGKPSSLILVLAFEGQPQLRTLSGVTATVWWQIIEKRQGFYLQQNIISQHYRLLDGEGNRIASSFNLEDLTALLPEGLEN
jgi:DNA-binding XRE family transcriptional regulator